MVQITYSRARANLAAIWDKVTGDNEVVVITRRGCEPVALISANELSSIMETAHLLRSPENARRLLSALNRAIRRTEKPSTLEDLYREVGLGGETAKSRK